MRKHNVFRFDIPMQYFLRMQVVDGITNLEQFGTGLVLLYLLAGLYVLVEGSLLHVLHEDVEVSVVTEKCIHFDYVGVRHE